MGFHRGIWRKYDIGSIMVNLKPRFNFGTIRLLGTIAGGGICLEDVKKMGTLEQKKTFMRKMLVAMASRMVKGHLGGCMDPTKISIIGDYPELPYESYVEGKYPTYLSSVENLANYLHEYDQLSAQERMKFDHFKKYSRLLRNTRHLALLAGHPYLQNYLEEMEYITAALDQLNSIRDSANHFPLPLQPDCQVPHAWAITLHPQLRYTWKRAYKKIIARKINIFATIQHAGKEFTDNYCSPYNWYKPRGYRDDDAVDELYYYSNFITYYCAYGDTEILERLHEKFPFNTMEMFTFHWTYDKHGMGTVDLESIMGIMTRLDL